MSELDEQVILEKQQIESAPKVPVVHYQPSGNAGRCSFCGQLAADLSYVDSIHGMDRYRGGCCGGTAYRKSE